MKLGIAALVGLLCSVVAANAAIAMVGMVTVGPGLLAPAGVYFAGLTFTLRDLVQDRLGWYWSLQAVLAGCLLSYIVSPNFAGASLAAFLVSEFSDFAVYTPLQKRSWLVAVLVSNTIGTVVDSALFLYLTFRSIEFLTGLVVGKTWITLVIVAAVWLVRKSGGHGVRF